MSTKITIEALKKDGWKINKRDPTCIAEKKIENRNPLNNSEDSDLKLIIHGMYNSNDFAILLPDGGMLNFSVNTMEQLKTFENAINFYDPPF